MTNQSGIGRGYYSEDNLQVLTAWMLEEFNKENIHISSVEHCNHSPESNCFCRKPQTGMVDRTSSTYNIDLENSWLIGDKQSDIDLAKNSMIKNSIAMGERIIENSTFTFKTILECKLFLEENNVKIR